MLALGAFNCCCGLPMCAADAAATTISWVAFTKSPTPCQALQPHAAYADLSKGVDNTVLLASRLGERHRDQRGRHQHCQHSAQQAQFAAADDDAAGDKETVRTQTGSNCNEQP